MTNHGILAKVVEGMLCVAWELFHLPKKAIRLTTSFNVRRRCYPLKSSADQWPSNPLSFSYPLESSVDQWPSNLPSSFSYPLESFIVRWPSQLPYSSSSSSSSSTSGACNSLRENIHRAILRCVHKLPCCSTPSYCLPISSQSQAPQPSRGLWHPMSPGRRTNFPQLGPHGSESRFSPPFDVKVEVVTDEATTDEDVSKLDHVMIAATFSLLVPMAINLDDLTSSWGMPWKVLYGFFLIVSLVSMLVGFFTASFPVVSRARSLSPFFARLGLVLATALFVLLIACKLGRRFGCASGVALAVLVMLVLTVLWICSEQPTSRASPHIFEIYEENP